MQLTSAKSAKHCLLQKIDAVYRLSDTGTRDVHYDARISFIMVAAIITTMMAMIKMLLTIYST